MKHPNIKLKLTHKLDAYHIEAPSNATFGDLKKYASEQTGIPPQGLQLLFRGRKKADSDVLSLAGVKNGAEVKIMETEGHRQHKAKQVREVNPFLDFTEEAAARARAAAAQESKRQRAQASSSSSHGAAPHRDAAAHKEANSYKAPPPAGAQGDAAAQHAPPPAGPPEQSAREMALGAIEAIRQQVDGLERQAHALEQGSPLEQATEARKKAALLTELLTQQLLSLDNVVVDGDAEVRQARKAEINRINQLCDRLEPLDAAKQ